MEANLVSPAALIVVAAAGICGFALPQRDFADAIRIWRFLLVVGGLMAGMAGVTLGLIALLLHLGNLRSLGVPYLLPISRGSLPKLRPLLVEEKYRPAELSPENRRNQR